MFAVIKTGGKQYKVAAQDILKIEKIAGNAGDAINFAQVLMIGGDGQTIIGTPMVENASVAAEVVEQGRARKIIVFKKKRRKNYRRTKGHRQELTTVKITEILADEKKTTKKAAKAPAPEEKASAADDTPATQTDSPLFTAPDGTPDDLKKISGVGPVLEAKLNALGITKFDQIANFSEDDIAKVDELLNFKGRIEREKWLDQARALAAGDEPDAQ